MVLPQLSCELLFNFKGFCTDGRVIMLFVYKKLRFGLSYRDLEELMTIGGSSIDHSTLQRWTVKFSKLISAKVKSKKRQVNNSWRMDETYVKVCGKWCYLYRAVDKFGNTVDFHLSRRRDNSSAKAFLRKAINNNGSPIKVVVIDGSHANKCALRECNTLKARQYEINVTKYLNNIVEQDHRFIKKKIKPMLGLKAFIAL